MAQNVTALARIMSRLGGAFGGTIEGKAFEDGTLVFTDKGVRKTPADLESTVLSTAKSGGFRGAAIKSARQVPGSRGLKRWQVVLDLGVDADNMQLPEAQRLPPQVPDDATIRKMKSTLSSLGRVNVSGFLTTITDSMPDGERMEGGLKQLIEYRMRHNHPDVKYRVQLERVANGYQEVIIRILQTIDAPRG